MVGPRPIIRYHQYLREEYQLYLNEQRLHHHFYLHSILNLEISIIWDSDCEIDMEKNYFEVEAWLEQFSTGLASWNYIVC